MTTTVPAPMPTRAAEQARGGREQRFALLLAALVATLFVQGAAPTGDVQRVVVSALVGATLVLALRAGDARHSLIVAAMATAAVLVTATVVEAVTGNIELVSNSVANALLIALAPPAVVVGVIRGIRRHQRVPVDAVLGVLSLYLLFGMFCAFAWAVLNHVDAPFFADGRPGTGSDFLYFSFVTLTTVGYGDLTARTPVGHTLAVFEALVGQIYLVTVVSLLVTNVGRERAAQRR